MVDGQAQGMSEAEQLTLQCRANLANAPKRSFKVIQVGRGRSTMLLCLVAPWNGSVDFRHRPIGLPLAATLQLHLFKLCTSTPTRTRTSIWLHLDPALHAVALCARFPYLGIILVLVIVHCFVLVNIMHETRGTGTRHFTRGSNTPTLRRFVQEWPRICATTTSKG